MILGYNGLKSAYYKEGMGQSLAIDQPTYYTPRMTQREVETVNAITNATSYLLALPIDMAINAYSSATSRGTAKEKFFNEWLFKQGNDLPFSTMHLAMNNAQVIDSTMRRIETNKQYQPFNTPTRIMITLLAMREVCNYLPIMEHTHFQHGLDKVKDLKANQLDITDYVIKRKKHIHELKLFLLDMISCYNNACEYIIKPQNINTLGASTMYLGAEYGRIVHRVFLDSTVYGFHQSPVYLSADELSLYPAEVRNAFFLAGSCQALKFDLEKGLRQYIHPVEFSDKVSANSLDYIKDLLTEVQMDVEINSMICDKYIAESIGSFINPMENVPKELNEDEALATALSYLEKTKEVSYSPPGKLKEWLGNNISLFDVLVDTAIELIQVRQLAELAVAQAKFINFYLILDNKRHDYITKHLFTDLKLVASQDKGGIFQIFDSTSNDSYKNFDLMDDLFFYTEKQNDFLSTIAELNLSIKAKMRDLFVKQANGHELPIFVVEDQTYEVAGEKERDSKGNMVFKADMGEEIRKKLNHTAANLENQIMLTAVVGE